MKPLAGLLLAVGLMACVVVWGPGCYVTPPVCAPNDTSCRSCADPTNTNDSCPPFPSDSTRLDAGQGDR